MTATKTLLTFILALASYAGATWLPVTMQIHDTLIEGARYLAAFAWAQHINPLPFSTGSGSPSGPTLWSRIQAAIAAAWSTLNPPPPAPKA